jgi:Trp operon repressor
VMMTVDERKDCIIRTHTNSEKTRLTFSERRIKKLPAPM